MRGYPHPERPGGGGEADPPAFPQDKFQEAPVGLEQWRGGHSGGRSWGKFSKLGGVLGKPPRPPRPLPWLWPRESDLVTRSNVTS